MWGRALVFGVRNNITVATVTQFSSAIQQPGQWSPSRTLHRRASSTSKSAQVRPFNEVPGPKALPFIGNTWRFIKGIGEYGHLDLVSLQREIHKDYGDIVRVSGIFGRKDQLWLFDPSYAETVFRNEGQWPLRDTTQILHYYRTVLRKERFNSMAGTMTSNGQDWASFRTKVNQPLMQPKAARKYFPAINQIAEEFVQKLRNARDANFELPADFMNEFYKWSIESIAAIALDTRLGCLESNLAKNSEPQRLIDAVHIVFDSVYELDVKLSIWRFVSTPQWRKFVAAMDIFTDIAEKYIQMALRRSETKDEETRSILERLLVEGPAVANLMASDMLFGGVDTTSNAVVTLLFYLAKNPEVQNKLADEVCGVLAKSPQEPMTSENLDAMPYLRACLKEALRISPIAVMNMRTTPKDLVIGGVHIPANTEVFMCHMVMSRDERVFARPMSFEPDRWLRGGGRPPPAHPFASLPFGFGPRTCLGRRFAELEIFVLIAKIVRNFKVEYNHGDELKCRFTLINNVDIPLQFRLTERK